MDDVPEKGWPAVPASPAAAAFMDVMTAALEAVMTAQQLRELRRHALVPPFISARRHCE
jgi:hypothetical protein